MLHKEFFGLLFLAFVVWVFLAGNPAGRIDRGCVPLDWTGNVITSLSSLVLPSQQEKMQRWTGKVTYGCRYTVWRLFYQSDYNEYMAKKALVPAPDAALADPGTPAPLVSGGAPAVTPP